MPHRPRSESPDSPRKRQRTGILPDDNGNAPIPQDDPANYIDPRLLNLFEGYNATYNFEPNSPPYDPSNFDPNWVPYDQNAQNFDPSLPPHDPNAQNFDPNPAPSGQTAPQQDFNPDWGGPYGQLAEHFDPMFGLHDAGQQSFNPMAPPYDLSALNFDDFPPADDQNQPAPEYPSPGQATGGYEFAPSQQPDPNQPAPEYPSPGRDTSGYEFAPSQQPAATPILPLHIPIRPAPDPAAVPANPAPSAATVPATAPGPAPRRRRKQLPRYNPYTHPPAAPRQTNAPGVMRITQRPNETAAEFAERVEKQRIISTKQRERRARERERSIRRGSPEQRAREREEMHAGLRPLLTQEGVKREVERLNGEITAEMRDWDEKYRACRACLTGRTYAGKCRGGMPCTECRARGHEGCERLEKLAWARRKTAPETWQPKGQKCRQCISRGDHCVLPEGAEEGDACDFCRWRGLRCDWAPLRLKRCTKCKRLHKCDNCRRIWTKCDQEIPCFVCMRKGIPCTGLFEDGRCPAGDDPEEEPDAEATAPTPAETPASATSAEPHGTKTGTRPWTRRKALFPAEEPELPPPDLPRGPDPDENGVIPCSRCLFAGYGNNRTCDDASPCWECKLRGVTNPEDCRATLPCLSCSLSGMPCDLDRPCARCRSLHIQGMMCRLNDNRQFNTRHRDYVIFPDMIPHTAAQWILPNQTSGDGKCAFCIVNGLPNCNPHKTPCDPCQEYGRSKERCRWHNSCARCLQHNIPCDIDVPCSSCNALDMAERRACLQNGDRSGAHVANPEQSEHVPQQQPQDNDALGLALADWPMNYDIDDDETAYAGDVEMPQAPDIPPQQTIQSSPPIPGDPPPTPAHVHDPFPNFKLHIISTTSEDFCDRPGEIAPNGHYEPRHDNDSFFGADLAENGCEEISVLAGRCNGKPTMYCDGTDQHEHEEGETHLLCEACRNKADQATARSVDELHAMKDLRCCRRCAESMYMGLILQPELASEQICACSRRIGGWLCYSCKGLVVGETRQRAERTRELLKNPQGEGTLCVKCRARPAMSEEMAQEQQSRALWRCGSCWKWIVKT